MDFAGKEGIELPDELAEVVSGGGKWDFLWEQLSEEYPETAPAVIEYLASRWGR